MNMFSAWSNVDGNIDVEFNDMIATLIGLVRDDVPFKEVAVDERYGQSYESYRVDSN